MAIRNDFTAGEVLAAADLNDTFASKVPYAYGTATPSTTVDGFVWYDENETPPAPKFWDGAAFQALGGGKVLQVVRATDTTNRTTTSTTFVDASISVTITPQKNDSAVLLIWSGQHITAANTGGVYQITDASNNAISGAERGDFFGGSSSTWDKFTLVGYDTPATISAVTYKGRFRTGTAAATITLQNANVTGQLFAIEVSA